MTYIISNKGNNRKGGRGYLSINMDKINIIYINILILILLMCFLVSVFSFYLIY